MKASVGHLGAGTGLRVEGSHAPACLVLLLRNKLAPTDPALTTAVSLSPAGVWSGAQAGLSSVALLSLVPSSEVTQQVSSCLGAGLGALVGSAERLGSGRAADRTQTASTTGGLSRKQTSSWQLGLPQERNVRLLMT